MQKTLTKEQLAHKLDGCEYRKGIPDELIEAARESNLVIIHGASDDLIEFYGSVTEEIESSTFFLLTRKGVPQSECDDGDDCPYYKRWLTRAKRSGEVKQVTAFWCGDVCGGEEWLEIAPKEYDKYDGPVWCFETDMPHSTFSMYETIDGSREYFCRGIVIDLDEAFPSRNYTQLVMEQGGWET